MRVGCQTASVLAMLYSRVAFGRDTVCSGGNRLVREVLSEHCVDESLLSLPLDDEVQPETQELYDEMTSSLRSGSPASEAES